MLVQSTEMVFKQGKRLRVDPESGLTVPFEITLKPGRTLAKHFVLVGEGAKEEVAPVKLSRKQIMADLTSAGIKYKPTLSTEDLQALLVGAKEEVAPAASTAPSKENQSVGDKDVI